MTFDISLYNHGYEVGIDSLSCLDQLMSELFTFHKRLGLILLIKYIQVTKQLYSNKLNCWNAKLWTKLRGYGLMRWKVRPGSGGEHTTAKRLLLLDSVHEVPHWIKPFLFSPVITSWLLPKQSLAYRKTARLPKPF